MAASFCVCDDKTQHTSSNRLRPERNLAQRKNEISLMGAQINFRIIITFSNDAVINICRK